MNVIIVIEKGIVHTPILVKKDTAAQAEFNRLAEELLGEDISEVNLHADDCVESVNRLLEFSGKEIHWFIDIEVNKYNQK